MRFARFSQFVDDWFEGAVCLWNLFDKRKTKLNRPNDYSDIITSTYMSP